MSLLQRIINESIGRRKFYVLVGPQGVGKSYWVQTNLNDPYIISYDNAVRAVADANDLRYSDIAAGKSPQHRRDIEQAERQQVTNAVASGKDIVIDKTNMSAKSRRNAFKAIRGNEADFDKVAVVFDFRGMEQDVLRSVEMRAAAEGDKHIPPDDVINTMNRFEMPSYEEGFDDIIIVDPAQALRR